MRFTNTLAAGLIVIAAVGGARAQTMTFHGSGMGRNVHIVDLYSSGTDVRAGQMKLSLANGPASFPTSWLGYCTDLRNAVGENDSYDVDLVPIPDSGLDNSQRIGWLYSNIGPSVANDDEAAGLQLAIWDVLTDNGDGLAQGAFRCTSSGAFATKAAQYLAASDGRSDAATWLRAKDHTGYRNQNMLGPVPPSAVPEPASLALLATGLLPLLRRRK